MTDLRIEWSLERPRKLSAKFVTAVFSSEAQWGRRSQPFSSERGSGKGDFCRFLQRDAEGKAISAVYFREVQRGSHFSRLLQRGAEGKAFQPCTSERPRSESDFSRLLLRGEEGKAISVIYFREVQRGSDFSRLLQRGAEGKALREEIKLLEKFLSGQTNWRQFPAERATSAKGSRSLERNHHQECQSIKLLEEWPEKYVAGKLNIGRKWSGSNC